MGDSWKEAVRARMKRHKNIKGIAEAICIPVNRLHQFSAKGYLGSDAVKMIEDYLDGKGFPAAPSNPFLIELDPTADDNNIALALQRAMVKEFGEARALGLAKMVVMLHECDFAHLYSAALRAANLEANES